MKPVKTEKTKKTEKTVFLLKFGDADYLSNSNTYLFTRDKNEAARFNTLLDAASEAHDVIPKIRKGGGIASITSRLPMAIEKYRIIEEYILIDRVDVGAV